MSQLGLFDLMSVEPPQYPPGLLYKAEAISRAEEAGLVESFQAQPFKSVIFQGYEAHRREVSYGWSYDFERGRLEAAEPIPDFLLPLRNRAAQLAGAAPDSFQQVLLLEYREGAAMGWHRDKAEFELVVGFSLLSPTAFRFRKAEGERWRRTKLNAEPRSAYVLAGEAREQWEHSIPPVDALRYSVTFRTFRAQKPQPRQRYST
jgi:alkylated DNA repair dioxygenase AlkB